ncbi:MULTISPECIES: hypothetical protein, partial [unclassified Streptomyces]|uniref:hypothetical protein n=1 Tax=unclassified Streptomyces TaxID=2593676 RepID=UPI00381E7914
AGKGNAKAKNWKAKAGSRFDRESDTKESDRVGNARPKGKARRKAPESVLVVSTKEASVP